MLLSGKIKWRGHRLSLGFKISVHLTRAQIDDEDGVTTKSRGCNIDINVTPFQSSTYAQVSVRYDNRNLFIGSAPL